MIVLLLAPAAHARPAIPLEIDSRETQLNEYLIVGTVVRVHTGSSSIAIGGTGLLGHLCAAVRSHCAKQPSALLNLQPGDATTAAFSRRDGMLHASDPYEDQRAILIK